MVIVKTAGIALHTKPEKLPPFITTVQNLCSMPFFTEWQKAGFINLEVCQLGHFLSASKFYSQTIGYHAYALHFLPVPIFST